MKCVKSDALYSQLIILKTIKWNDAWDYYRRRKRIKSRLQSEPDKKSVKEIQVKNQCMHK
jgi:hypothetical protein